MRICGYSEIDYLTMDKLTLPDGTNNQRADLQTLAKLNVADWRITSVCDLDCPFCFGPKDIPHLPKPEALKITEFLARIGVKAVCLSGGEPLLYPHIREVIKYLHTRGIKVLLSTNGNRFREFKDVIEECVTRLSLPLDGYCANAHKLAGRTEENYYSVLSALESFGDQGCCKIKIGTVVSALNLGFEDNLYKIYKLLLGYSVDQWKIYEFVPEGESAHLRNSLLCANGEFDKAVNALYNQIQSSSLAVDVRRRKLRNRGYFLLQPNGDVIMPSD